MLSSWRGGERAKRDAGGREAVVISRTGVGGSEEETRENCTSRSRGIGEGEGEGGMLGAKGLGAAETCCPAFGSSLSAAQVGAALGSLTSPSCSSSSSTDLTPPDESTFQRVSQSISRHIARERFYDAHQLVRTLYSRYCGRKQYATAARLCYVFSLELGSKCKQFALAADLSECLVDVFRLAEAPITPDRIELLLRLFQVACCARPLCTTQQHLTNPPARPLPAAAIAENATKYRFMDKAILWSKNQGTAENQFHNADEELDAESTELHDAGAEETETEEETPRRASHRLAHTQPDSVGVGESGIITTAAQTHISSNSGHPRLHLAAALAYWSEGMFGSAQNHLVLCKGEGKALRRLLKTWTPHGYRSEKDLFMLRGVLMLLAVNDTLTPAQLLGLPPRPCSSSPSSSPSSSCLLSSSSSSREAQPRAEARCCGTASNEGQRDDGDDDGEGAGGHDGNKGEEEGRADGSLWLKTGGEAEEETEPPDLDDANLPAPIQLAYFLVEACRFGNYDFYQLVLRKYQLVLRRDGSFDRYLQHIEANVFGQPRRKKPDLFAALGASLGLGGRMPKPSQRPL